MTECVEALPPPSLTRRDGKGLKPDDVYIQSSELSSRALSTVSLPPLASGEDALPEQPLTRHLLFATFVASIGSFQYGWNIGTVSIPADTIHLCTPTPTSSSLPDCLPMSSNIWAFFIGSFALGGLFGGLLAGPLTARFGRLIPFHITNAIFLAAGVFMAASVNPGMIIFGRFLSGLGTGAASSVVPMYVGEISPPMWRGVLGTVFSFSICIGLNAAQLISIPLNYYPGWRILFAGTAVWAIFMSALLPWCYETPKYLVSKGKITEARASLAKLRETDDVTLELSNLLKAHEEEHAIASASMSILEIVRSRTLRKPLLLASMLHIAQQLSGISPIFAFSAQLFSGFMAPSTARWVSVALTFVNTIGTAIAALLMDRSGRRVLLLTAIAGMAACEILIIPLSLHHASIPSSIFLIITVFFYALGLGPVPWLLIPEIFPTTAISAASSCSTSLNWMFVFVMSYAFPQMQRTMGVWSFLVFAGFMVAAGIGAWFMLPETRERDVESVVEGFRKGKWRSA
ncbi:general substrate transporter [Saitoella complicata NRRL Y-17804]|nr:general substrate transporter [Saitoella complicata NRRL Y-17804]ODQ55829.1 general substrate transporter [Saitoella complicata NRRL Y-17804]